MATKRERFRARSQDPRIVSDWIAEARAADILDVAQGLCDGALKRSGASEWCGPCPAGCASMDGFAISTKKRVFVCRPSGKGGDVIAMAAHALGYDFLAAVTHITGRQRPGTETPAPISSEEREVREEARGAAGAETAERRRAAEAAEETRRERSRAMAASVWNETLPIAGSLGASYFQTRGIVGPLPRALRFHPSLEQLAGAGGEWPAIVAPVTNVQGEQTGVHVTYLTEGGRVNKQLGPKRKIMLGTVRGGAVRLIADGKPLLIAEGIETALSAYQLARERYPDAAVWAALSTSGLR